MTTPKRLHPTDPLPQSPYDLGIIGGGQLGWMLSIAAKQLGLRTLVLTDAPGSTATLVSDHLVGSYNSAGDLQALAQRCSTLTYEFENVDVQHLVALGESTPIHPSPRLLAIAQDRWLEKQHFESLGIPAGTYAPVDQHAPITRAAERTGLPAILKTRRFGYDGKGQWRLTSSDQIPAIQEQLGDTPAILEAQVPFDRELSIIGVRAKDGQCKFYPLFENHHVNGILDTSTAPAPNTAPLQPLAEQYLRTLLEHHQVVGVVTLELFECQGELIANECAPRVHNSGHLTIEAASTSQFENHVRAVCGLPLGDTNLNHAATMQNFVGTLPNVSELQRTPHCHVHDYKKAPRAARKLGHATTLKHSISE